MSNKKKRKIRVAFRKNRQKRPRDKPLVAQAVEDDSLQDALPTREGVTGKSSLARRRTVIGVEEPSDDGSGLVIDVDESKCLQGRVLTAVGLNCVVQATDGREYECTVRRLLRSLARDTRSAVVAGDWVLFQPTGDEQGVIERVEPRRATLSRSSQGREHVLVANVDQVLIVTSAADPQIKPNLIDRLIISAEKGGAAAVICINKADLVDPADFQPIIGRYSQLGYDVVLASASDGRGISRLRSLLNGRETVLAGQSGVGKSSLLNALQPGLDRKTAAISSENRKGRHTTRNAVLIQLDSGGWVVDTPGIRQLALWDVIPEEVEGYFVEFRPFVAACKFSSCSHIHEDHCAVKSAVHRGLISTARYRSYLQIVESDNE